MNRSVFAPAAVAVCLAILAGPAPAGEPIGVERVDWWIDTALTNLDAITSAEQKSGASYALVYPLKHAGRPQLVARVAGDVTGKPQRRIYAERAAAQAFLEAGDEQRYHEIMRAAESIAIEGERAGDLVTQYLKSGHVEHATRLALQTPNRPNDPQGFLKTHLLNKIPVHLATTGDLDAAFRFVDRHVQHKEDAYREIAYAVARTGRVEQSERAISKLTEDRARDNARGAFAQALAQRPRDLPPLTAGQLKAARSFVGAIANSEMRALAIAIIDSREGGDLDLHAQPTADNGLASREAKEFLLQRRFHKLIEANRPAEAEAVIRSMIATIESTPQEAKQSKFGVSDDEGAIAAANLLYLHTAPLWKKIGEDEKAKNAVERASKAFHTAAEKSYLMFAFSLPGLVSGLLAVDDRDGARELLRRCESQSTYGKIGKGEIANSYLLVGDHDKAAEILADLPAGPTRGGSLGRAAAAWIAAGEFDRAKDLLARFSKNQRDLKGYQAAAQRLVSEGRTADLRAWLPDMPSDAARVYASAGAITALNRLAEQQAQNDRSKPQ